MTIRDRIKTITQEKNSLVCVGLDPDVRKMPKSIQSDPEPLFTFCSAIIESTREFAAAFKLNFAFCEADSSKGWCQLEKLVEILPKDTLTIADAKRADIGNTSEHYAKAIFDKLQFDTVTVNPYLGGDSLSPFLQRPDKGAFVLCVTSNPGSKDLQRLQVGSVPLYQKVIEKVHEWNHHDNCGLVVGATHPDELADVRKLAPALPFLIPGIGAQGGNLESAVKFGTDGEGLALFNASRSIIYKSNDSDFAEVAAREAELLRDQINEHRDKGTA